MKSYGKNLHNILLNNHFKYKTNILLNFIIKNRKV